MRDFLSNIITADNYTIIIICSGIASYVLFGIAKETKYHNLRIAAFVIMCILFIVVMLTLITAWPYMDA